MHREAIKNKAIYLFSLLSMCLILILVAYFFFLRTIPIDLTKNVALIYSGENGQAKVEALNTAEDLNQRIQEFYDSISYTVEPDKNLSNGDEITVSASYDESLSQQYHFQPTNQERVMVVSGLPNRFESKEQIDEAWIEKIQTEMDKYLNDHAKSVLGFKENDVHLLKDELVYFAFLKSDSSDNSDRFVGMYRVEYLDKEEPKVIYYLVLVPDINESMHIETQNIYGERAYLSVEEDEQARYGEYIERVFGSQYTIEAQEETIETEDKTKEEETKKEGDDQEKDQ